MSTPHPTEVRWLEGERTLVVTFTDDLVQRYPAAFLRGFCPCARCQGHGSGPPTYRVPRTEAATRIDDVSPVGNYAMCISWGDGHDTGIYSFSLLRDMDVAAFDEENADEGDVLPLRNRE